MKNRIRLTESDLHRIVKESVNRVLREWDEYLKNRIIKTNIGDFRLEKGDDAIYAVSIADNDFYYTLPKEMEFAQYKEIQNYINDIAENEHEY